MEGIKFFFDSYAIIESIKGNSAYVKYKDKVIITSFLNLIEVSYAIMRDFDEHTAKKEYAKLKDSIVEIDEDTMFEAIIFRLKHKSKKLSYIDCIGYIYALRNNLLFLTGDKEFQDMKNTEFIKK